uniref:Uncharacterized protein n=1 Tax=Rhodosorus marinus TaxID=101924 RepID=A0A7S2ZHB9_9RHOD|mmetsp:Transcript_19543/g.77882  ORF Transcript_19543/g.77882 Transcript_19543/m.77882 type:complete len:147 (+) Transcript_19543:109-549(+)
MSRLSRIFRSCDVRSARKEVHRGYSGGALRTTKVLACEDKGEEGGNAEGGGENEKEKELGFGEESLDDLCEDTKFLMDCMIPERQRKYFDFRDSKLTFVDFLYRLPHFGEGRRLTRRKWLMMNLHDTYMVRLSLNQTSPYHSKITS